VPSQAFLIRSNEAFCSKEVSHEQATVWNVPIKGVPLKVAQSPEKFAVK
jgi:hypothetical protein